VFERTGASAVSAANLFHFSEHSVITTKALLRKCRMNIRLDTHADYSSSLPDNGYRLKKHNDDYLEELLFQRIEKEII
jgi:imidazole glycerol-phosphate synthase subunit HisF